MAVIGEVNIVDMLPKTRSGKIMRRVLKAVVLGASPATSPRSRTRPPSKKPARHGRDEASLEGPSRDQRLTEGS